MNVELKDFPFVVDKCPETQREYLDLIETLKRFADNVITDMVCCYSIHRSNEAEFIVAARQANKLAVELFSEAKEKFDLINEDEWRRKAYGLPSAIEEEVQKRIKEKESRECKASLLARAIVG